MCCQEGDLVRIKPNFCQHVEILFDKANWHEELGWRGKVGRLGNFDSESQMWEVWSGNDYVYAFEEEFYPVTPPYEDITREDNHVGNA